jgi:hypothetical protein
MPYALILGAFAVFVLYRLFNTYRGLSRNITLAKSSGLPYVVTPWNVFSIVWLSTFALWTPLLKKFLPASLQGLWIE